jgi:hypothetical protein
MCGEKIMTKNIFGLLLGAFIGWNATPLIAQTITKYKIDSNNSVCWDQPHDSLAAANAMHVRVTYDTSPTIDPVSFICSGSTSPFTCKLSSAIPISNQSVGTHHIVVEGANLDPIDNTYTAYATLIDFQVDLANAAQPPQKGGNGRIIKLGTIAIIALGVLAYLINHS